MIALEDRRASINQDMYTSPRKDAGITLAQFIVHKMEVIRRSGLTNPIEGFSFRIGIQR